jgi:hypothetical protein
MRKLGEMWKKEISLAVNEFHLNVYLAPRTAAINAFEIIIIY